MCASWRCNLSSANPDIATTIAGSANPQNIRNWAKWVADPIDEQLLREVLEIFKPVKDAGHQEGLAWKTTGRNSSDDRHSTGEAAPFSDD